MRAFIVKIEDDGLEDSVVAADILDILTSEGYEVLAVNPWGTTAAVTPQAPPEVTGLIPPM